MRPGFVIKAPSNGIGICNVNFCPFSVPPSEHKVVIFFLQMPRDYIIFGFKNKAKSIDILESRE